MARKGENIYKRKDGRWEGRYIVGRRPDGKALYSSIYGKRYSEVKALLSPLKAAHAAASEQARAGFSGTVWDWLSFWMSDLRRPHIKPATYASYRNKLERHVLPALGAMRLSRLRGEDVQGWIDDLAAKGLAGSSIGTIFRILNAALQTAVYRHHLFSNPCDGVTLPALKRPETRVLTLTQQKELERQALNSRYGEAVILALYTGMRIGEISALTWQDVDLERNLIHVRRTMQRIPDYDAQAGAAKTKMVTDIPKTHTSNRLIPFADNLKGHLLRWRAASRSEYVVPCKGGFAEARVISYRYQAVAGLAGITGIPFHGLRHTYATRCLERGIDIATLSRLLGHASIKMTLDVYADSTLEQRKTAMTVLDALLAQDGPNRDGPALALERKENLTALLMELFRLEMAAVS